ncbi:amine oxidoreductase [bacterium C-53]|nr:amine oxidoreductase [Lachnospiraceae bacterium]NBI04518.1 amine oxidoreductase [Lachnospiraceae bacterium]RKJ08094.1 amine oxidoreductase [bacterium C-53]
MKYLILGAGPSGLSFAYRLLQKGEKDFLILEKEAEAGGLCRSIEINDAPLDIGGGHFVDTRDNMVLELLFEVMPREEWNIYERNSQIALYDQFINSPIESNIWQFSIEKQIDYLKEAAVAGCNLGEPKPNKFVEWIYWKLGKKIAEDYMIPYNQKMFGNDLDILGTYWLDKLPNVSFEETLRSCLEKKAYGTQPGHAKFLYPKKYGSGEVWKRMADKLSSHIRYNICIDRMDVEKLRINDEYKAEKIICTIPWTEFKEISGLECSYADTIKQLRYSSIVVEYVAENLQSDAQWIYYPDLNISYHRILNRTSFSQGDGYWTETNAVRYKPNAENYSYMNKYAYPLNTIDKPIMIKKLLKKMSEKNVFGLGRWGEWQHYNSDVVVRRAVELADRIH